MYMQCGLCVLEHVHSYNGLSHQVCWIFRGMNESSEGSREP
jgi:hypothetical protein